MRSERTSTNSTTISAATLIAVLAMLSCATTASSVHPVACDTRATLDESKAVRAMAAAVAAVARDLLGTDRSMAALPPMNPCDEPVIAPPNRHLTAWSHHLPPRTPLAERLLDLPPPSC